jgi:undecaprenyl-diphosphatase
MMIDKLIHIDEQFLLALNSHHTPLADVLMEGISGRFTWIPLYIFIVALMFWRFGWKRALIGLVLITIAITVTDQLCAHLIRPQVARLRPSNLANPFSAMVTVVNDYRAGAYSFPSCHAANTFAFATIHSLLFRRKWITWSIFGWATMVSCSRLYLGVHYPSDLFVGAIIGSGIAFALYWICRQIPQLRRFAASSKGHAPVATAMVLLAIGAAAPAATAQRLAWGVEFGSVFDNREGSTAYAPAETFFLTQLAPEIGLKLDAAGQHAVMGGVAWTQPIGSEWDDYRLSPTLYYRYRSAHWSGSMGMFPRTQLLRELPNYLASDSTRYFQHNIRGAMLQYQADNGFFEALIDWRGMQSETRREAFAIIAQGEWQQRKSHFLAGGVAMMNHLAKQKNAPADQFVVDNLLANPYVGVNFANLAPLSELTLKVGALGSLTRDRGAGDWLSSVGLWVDLNAQWWRLGLQNTLYCGNKPLFPLYSTFGTTLNDGEPYYASKLYNRTSLTGLILKRGDSVELKASVDFNFTQHEYNCYQRLILKVTI